MSDQQPPESGDLPPTPPPTAPPSYPSYPSYPADAGGAGGGYGDPAGYAQPGQPAPYRVFDALGLGFRLFGKHLVPFLLLGAGVVLIAVAFGGIGYLTSDHSTTSTSIKVSFSASQVILQLIGSILSTLVGASLIKGALDAVDGRSVSLGAMFEGWDKLQVLIAAIIVNIVVTIGFVLLIIPGIIALFLTWFTTFFVVAGKPAVESLGASVNFASKHAGPILLTGLLAIVVNIVGLCLCGVGLFVSLPVSYIMAACAFRQLQGHGVVTA